MLRRQSGDAAAADDDDSKKIKVKKRRKGEIIIPFHDRRFYRLPFLSISYGHPHHELPQEGDWSETEDEYLDEPSRVKGVSLQGSSPWFAQHIATSCRFIYEVAQLVSQAFLPEFAHELFGADIATYVDDVPIWTSEPIPSTVSTAPAPAKDPYARKRLRGRKTISRNAANNQEVMKIIFDICMKTEQRAYQKIRPVVEDATEEFHDLFIKWIEEDEHNSDLDHREAFVNLLPFSTILSKYRKLGAQLPTFMESLLRSFHLVGKQLSSAEWYKKLPENRAQDVQNFLQGMKALSMREEDLKAEQEQSRKLRNLATDAASDNLQDGAGDTSPLDARP
ncbi:uncharacterized protein I303_101632 [Kwoniella dejecticola CBS 10117]|uniref:Uncharacterized protein n=1 Tax=Kwoniella dejecticola CBS 10117 TaxID=1296121 RepID=A0A1A6AD83_9TREE|nr:uncharacterized protein I303_02232 [Kwoniella dejecticola CBS 10117]OBR88015.1 hypothetical protein I303_02232 [Kwoniella dejecticola CBS 10117]